MTVGELINELQRFDAAMPVRYVAGGGCSCEDYFLMGPHPKAKPFDPADIHDACLALKEGDEYVEL